MSITGFIFGNLVDILVVLAVLYLGYKGYKWFKESRSKNPRSDEKGNLNKEEILDIY